MPLVDLGLVNLIPDPCDFDFHLREQMMMMARARSPRFDPKDDPRLQRTMEEDNRRGIMLMPPDAMRRQLRKLMPHLDEKEVEEAMRARRSDEGARSPGRSPGRLYGRRQGRRADEHVQAHPEFRDDHVLGPGDRAPASSRIARSAGPKSRAPSVGASRRQLPVSARS